MILLNDGNLQDKLSKIHQNKDKADVDTTPTFKCTTSESCKSLYILQNCLKTPKVINRGR